MPEFLCRQAKLFQSETEKVHGMADKETVRRTGCTLGTNFMFERMLAE
jgi:hypothetical protein